MVEVDLHEDTKRVLIRRLMKETGIKEAEARDLVEAIGPHWTSLVREARMIPTEHSDGRPSGPI